MKERGDKRNTGTSNGLHHTDQSSGANMGQMVQEEKFESNVAFICEEANIGYELDK